MHRTSKFSILLVATSLAFAIVWLAFKTAQPKPSYQGKPVNYWLHELNFATGDVRRAEWAFRFMDSNAVPFLVATLDKTDGPLKQVYFRCYPKLPAILKTKLPRPVPADELRDYAISALGAIGPAAKPAIPSLLNVLANAPNGSRRQNVLTSLDAIDGGQYQQEVLDAWLRARSDSDPEVARVATTILTRRFPLGVPDYYETLLALPH
jgi:hypothetical protein